MSSLEGLRVKVSIVNPDREGEVRRIEDECQREFPYRHYSRSELEEMKAKLDTEFPPFLDVEGVIMFHDMDQAIIERMDNHKLMKAPLEGLYVVPMKPLEHDV